MRVLTRGSVISMALTAGAGLALLLVAGYLLLRGTIGGVTFTVVAMAIVLVYAAAVGVAVWRLGRHMSGLVDDLTGALERVADGDFEDVAIDHTAPGSHELADALDTLRQRLKASTISRDHLDRMLSAMNEAVLVTDAEDRIFRVNDAAGALAGCDARDLLGRQVADMLEPLPLNAAPAAGKRATPREATVRRRDGSAVTVSYTVATLRDAHGALEGKVYAAQDITDRKRVEQRIRYLARTDILTRLENRMQFQHRMQQAIARARRTGRYMAILYIDVDRFKDINDTYGHAAGDISLEIFARRIVNEIPPEAAAGRLAGDEFAVLLRGFDDLVAMASEVTGIARRLLHAVGRPFQVHGNEVFMTMSMGIALYPRDGDNVIDLLRNADAALYHAKRTGGNCFEFYTADMNNAAVERLMLKSRLRRAFERDELRLHYQPKYNLKTGRVEGAEALVRWKLPERGLVYPSDFIPLAEETNLILQVGDWVLNRVCADYRLWQRSLPSPGRVAVNLSLRQLHQQRFLERTRDTFRLHGVSPTCLEFEITETTLMEDAARTMKSLNALYAMGLHLAIDDFGTGYSSLSALQQFPIGTLKIDQSFVRDVAIDRDDAAIVSTIIRMAHSLRLDVVAEGVESMQQLQFLRAHGCTHAQGHLFGDPMTSEDYRELLLTDAAGRAPHPALSA